jgi:hypothetical protein
LVAAAGNGQSKRQGRKDDDTENVFHAMLGDNRGNSGNSKENFAMKERGA